ncbi:hypothetical protein [Rhizobium sp. SGZ-381]|uniref:hypothetical protein n=1 Tax=Rhizobium sp. SGZ-381 TaxID=3342800 RepID=UPI00366ECD62
MADFVAVIRRAVDGLANNNPEMRIRVYEKARGAVQRQLENMKPRPSDEMLRRQMDKLEAAIREVEAEHREAAPAADEPFVQPPPVDVAPAAWQETAAVPEPSPAHAEPQAFAEPAVQPEPQDETPASPAAVPEAQEAPYEAPYHEPQSEAVPEAEAYQAEPVHAADPYGAAPEHDDARPFEAEPVAPVHEPADPEPQAPAHDAHQDLTAVPAAMPEAHAPADENPFADDDEADVPRGDAPRADEAEARTYAEAPRFPVYDEPPRTRAQMAPAWPDAPSTAPSLQREDPFSSDVPEADQHPQETAPQVFGHDDWHGSVQAATGETGETLSESASIAVEPAPVADWNNSAGWNAQPDWQAQDEAERPETPAAAPVVPAFIDRQAADLFEAHFDREAHVTAKVEMPAVTDLPDYPAPAKAEPDVPDPLATYLQPIQTTAKVEAPAASSDPWNDLEQLIGYDKTAAEKGGRGEDLPAEEPDLAEAAPARAYRVQTKPKRNYGVWVLAILGLAVLGGGGYAIWLNRDALDNMIGNVAGEKTAPAATTASAPPSSSNATAPASTQPPKGTATATATAPAAASGTPAAAGPTKFTQRLLANGTEVDDGAGGPAAGGASQSIAQLNAPAAPDAGGNTNAVTTPAAPSSSAPPATPAATPAVSGEKIFLYEERIGQSSPTAIEGRVSWSLQSETGENGRPEPVVQGRINLPERGLTALITFKRNADASLPASHLVEFVFSLPADFEGGAIESVQRISMKQTEQDRGDPLIAVPAKITPDFHMIALNDFPDARARNMELLKSRNWLDVPIIYGTGRRALLTLQKGSEGVKAFDEAIRQWAALSPAGQ